MRSLTAQSRAACYCPSSRASSCARVPVARAPVQQRSVSAAAAAAGGGAAAAASAHMESLVDDAVVWASQHGLVSRDARAAAPSGRRMAPHGGRPHARMQPHMCHPRRSHWLLLLTYCCLCTDCTYSKLDTPGGGTWRRRAARRDCARAAVGAACRVPKGAV